MINNFIKNRELQDESPLLHFPYKNRQYRIEFLNTGFETFAALKKKTVPFSNRQQHSHSVFHLLLFKDGAYHYIHNGNKVNFSPGTFIVTNPNEPHTFSPSSYPHAVSYYFLTFSINEIDSGALIDIDFRTFLEIFANEPVGDIHLPMKFNKRQVAIFENLTTILTKQLISRAPLSSFSVGMTMLNIINFVLHECCSDSTADKFRQIDAPIEKAKLYIEKNFKHRITIAEIASIASLEPSYFIRKFRNKFHVTPINYQMELKINAAKTLLKTTDFRISELAEQVGISDIYYFSRLFKKYTGKCPSIFRKTEIALLPVQ